MTCVVFKLCVSEGLAFIVPNMSTLISEDRKRNEMKGLQETQNAALSPAKRPIQGFAEEAFIAVRLICT